MTVGIAYANLGHPMKCINDSIEDFKDMVWSALGAGSSLQELYISHDRMKPEFWPILAQAAKWAKENEGVLKDTHWVGGSPINLEVYGFASWKPGKGIIMLRNPDELTVSYDLKLDEAFELPTDNEFEFQMRDPRISEDSQIVESVTSKDTLKLLLKPFETKLLEFDTFSN